MDELVEIVEILNRLDALSQKYFKNDSEIRYHTACIMNKFLEDPE